jgi:hypothetical protein
MERQEVVDFGGARLVFIITIFFLVAGTNPFLPDAKYSIRKPY